jgi:beta-phosphoglucomutase
MLILGLQRLKPQMLPIGVGKAEVLGSDIALVSDTSQLTLDFLIEVWDNQ